jgi:hypothetical protein
MIGWEPTPEPTQQPFGPPSTYSTVAPLAAASAFNVNFTPRDEGNSSNSSSIDQPSSRKLVGLDHLVSAGEKASLKFAWASMLASLFVCRKSL